MYVITGVTGNTGSVVANRLLDAGKKVRVVVRDASKAKAFAARGAEVFVADLKDCATLSRAFEGAEGVYVLSPPDLTSKAFLEEKKELAQTVATALTAAKPKHVVLLSSVGAHQESGTGVIRSVHSFETALRGTNLPVTFVRAAYFMENWASVLPVAKKDGVLPTFLPANTAIPMVAAKDIGVALANALLEGPRGVRIIELSGPVDISPADVASAAARILGRPVNAIEAPLSAVVPTFTSFGVSENVAQLFRGMNEGVINGTVAFEKTGTESARGTTRIDEVIKPLLA